MAYYNTSSFPAEGKSSVWAPGSAVLSALRGLSRWGSVRCHTWLPRWPWAWRKSIKKRREGKGILRRFLAFFFFQTREALLLLLHTPIPLARTQQCGYAHLPGSWASSLAMFPERKGKSLPQVGALVSILHRRKWIGTWSKQERQFLNVGDCSISLQLSERYVFEFPGTYQRYTLLLKKKKKRKKREREKKKETKVA